jgi:hypothetical protein
VSRTSSAVVVSAIVLAGIGALGATTGASSHSVAPPVVTEQPGAPVQYSATIAESSIATTSDADLLQAELSRRSANTAILDAQVRAGGGTSAAHGLQLDLSSRTLDRGGWIQAFWEGSLLQGALAEGLATGADTSTGISGGTFVIHLPDGTSKDVTAGAGKVRTGQVFRRLDATGHLQATSDIHAVVESFGLRLASTTFYTYRDDAIAVIADVPPGGSLHDFESLRLALTGSPASYEGVYLEVRDSSGVPIAVSASAFRNGAGVLWVDPTVAGTVGELQRSLHN